MSDPNEKQEKRITKTTLENTASLVAQYAKTLAGDDRAKFFAAHVSLLARDNPALAEAEQQSLLTAMMACVHLDLPPNTPEGYAYVIPYKNHRSGKTYAQFQVGYKGLVELAYRSGQIKSLSAEIVLPGDEFEVQFGSERKLVHKPKLDIDRTDVKDFEAAYATATLENGETVFEVMTKSEIDKVMKSAKAKSTDAPWKTWTAEMIKKTVIKRLTKLLPKSAKDNRLAYAVSFDSLAEAGKLTVDNEGRVIELPKPSAELDEDEKQEIDNTKQEILETIGVVENE